MRDSVNYAKHLIGLLLGLAVLVSYLILQTPSTRPTLVSNVSPHSALSSGPLSVADWADPEPDQATQARVLKAYDKLPMRFEANQGQTDGHVKFLSRGRGYTLFLTPTEAVLALRIAECGMRNGFHLNPKSEIQNPQSADPQSAVLRMKLVGANPTPQAVGLEELPGKSNYFIGNDPQKWRTEIPHYARVEYQNVYPGVNLVYYGNQQQLEYDFVVAPGADPRAITLSFQGASKLKIDAQGDLVLHMAGGEIRQHKPLIYQEINGAKQAIAGHYVLRGKHQAGFELSAYDTSRPLIIDPRLRYSTYLGGSGDDQAFGIILDAAGNIYVTGQTSSSNFPTRGPFQNANRGGSDVFVTKIDPSKSGRASLVYSTYLGGSGFDSGRSIAVDDKGNVYVTGVTTSINFPTKGPFQDRNRGGSDAFVTKLNPAGNMLVYSTYLGGSGDDAGFGIDVDGNGNAYVTGRTASNDFPTESPYQRASGGRVDAFVTKLNAAGNRLVYSTYLGGGRDDIGFGIAVDANGNAYVTGETASNNFPTASPYQAEFGGVRDAFVTKLNPTGSALVYSTYLGSTGDDRGNAIALDAAGNAYVTGSTSSFDFPEAFPYGGGIDAFVTKFNAQGSALLYSRYLGGSGFDAGFGIAVDTAGSVYVTGSTTSTNFPTARPTQAANGGGSDAFVAKLDALGETLDYSTYLGGRGSDSGRSIAVDTNGNIYVTGATNSNNFPTTNPFQPVNRGGPYDAFIVKIGQTIPTAVTLDQTTVTGGTSLMGKVTLNEPAESGGDVVNLSSSKPEVAAPQDTVTVPEGATTATFSVETSPVSAPTSVTISASRNTVTRRATLTVVPPVLDSVSLFPTTVVGGDPSTGTVTLNGPAPSGGAVVELSSSKPEVARVPTSITVPALDREVTFDVQTTSVAESTSVIISASYRGVTKTATLMVISQFGAVNGRVTNAFNGTPISGATVEARQEDVLIGSSTTDTAGNYRIGNLAAGTYDIYASASGFTSQTTTGVVVESGTTTTVNFSLTPMQASFAPTEGPRRWQVASPSY